MCFRMATLCISDRYVLGRNRKPAPHAFRLAASSQSAVFLKRVVGKASAE